MFDDKITQADIDFIAANMRDADRAEVAAASGLPPDEVLMQGIERSAVSVCVKAPDGEPLFIVGVVEGLDGGVGVIWLLGTDGILKHKRTLHKLAKAVIAEWHKTWSRLTNIVDARNTVHIRWLKAMGFQFGEPVIAGVAQIPFIPFSRTQSIV